MRAILHPDIQIRDGVLVDSFLDVGYTITPDALWLVGQLLQEGRLDRLVPTVARLRCLSEPVAKHAVYSLLGQLGEFGAVRIAWGRSLSAPLRWKAGWAWYERRPGTLRGCLRACLRAYWWVFGLLQAGFVALYFFSGGIAPMSLMLLPGLLAATLVLHELGHIVAARAYHIPALLLARPGHSAVLYRRSKAGTMRVIALAGPFAAAAGCLLVWVVYPMPTMAGLLYLAVAVVHIGNLLPYFADGRTLWRSK